MRATKSLPVLFCFFSAATYVAIAACGNSDFDGQKGDASVVNGNGCDGTQTPSQNQCVVDDAFGVFVATTGADGADGARATPLKTLKAGIIQAKLQKKRVYVCLGTYTEQVTLSDGVSVFGNLDCTQNWLAVTAHAKVQSPSSPAVIADQIQSPTRFDSIDVSAPNGSADSKNSVGLLATSSPGVIVANATIHAGTGFDGVDGNAGIQLTQSANVSGSNGDSGGTTSANCSLFPAPSPLCNDNPGGGGTSSCVAPSDAGVDGGEFNGGVGGAGGSGAGCIMASGCMVGMIAAYCCSGVGAGASQPGSAQPGNASTAQGTTTTASATAQPGAIGSAGANGLNGSSKWIGTTFSPGDGTAGKDGIPGQGGGGGAGANPISISASTNGDFGRGPGGAGGGAGGCPGLSGGAGTGGGASIGIVTTESPLTFDTCIIQTSNGGKAGKGALGSDPTSGGAPGNNSGVNQVASNTANSGGAGGAAGWSGNGSPGPSYGIASSGAPPVLKNTTTQLGAGGTGVPAQTSGAKTIPATPVGVSAATVTF